jgi:2-polyprenyl-3-methyl-5-hydroxy-6-metoxy-1,4-benzoquinol methylase
MSHRLADFAELVKALNPIHQSFLHDALSRLEAPDREELLKYFDYCTQNGLDLAYLAGAYNLVVTDMQLEQIFFRRHKRYRHSCFAAVADSVYFDDHYMRNYMHGLALTTFLWPNHLAMRNFFVRTFPPLLTGRYLEVGPGHGYYFLKAAQLGKFHTMIGVDISASSVELTRDLLRHFDLQHDRASIVEADFVNFQSDQIFSCIVMGEVIEHVERPEIFLSKLAELADEKTHIYVTTAINSPAIDHIYLFRSSQEVERLAASCGLYVVQKLCLPYAGMTLGQTYERAMPVNAAYVLRKAATTR